MIIAQKKILKFPVNLEDEKDYYIVVEATRDNLLKLGIENFEDGLAIQPSSKSGITSRRNINGYYIVDKNLPKEERLIRTIYWEWQLFNGEWCSDYKDIYKECYTKKYIEPFAIEMVLKKLENGKKIILTKLDKDNNGKNIINLYLEVFGYCEILDNKFDSILTKTKIIRRNWEILPPDIKIKITSERNKDKEDAKNKSRDYNQSRLDELEKYKPIERNIGKNGFQGYYAFVYDKICILESPIYGNATYIIENDNWKNNSMKTKKDIIKTKNFLKRIEHDSKWFKEIHKYFK